LDTSKISTGEVHRHGLVLLAENAHAVVATLREQAGHASLLGDRHQHQWRIERHGHERVRGHAVHLSVHGGGDDRDSGREGAQAVPERDRIEPL
jgi:hypothetical protein